MNFFYHDLAVNKSLDQSHNQTFILYNIKLDLLIIDRGVILLMGYE